MTGNTKVWRAPLAGLASLAMVATMGVSALTANAAFEPAATAKYTVTLNADGNGRGLLGSALLAKLKSLDSDLSKNTDKNNTSIDVYVNNTKDESKATTATIANVSVKTKVADLVADAGVKDATNTAFKYWTANSAQVNVADTTVTGNLDLTAAYAVGSDKDHYTVKFSGLNKDEQVWKGDKLASWQVPTDEQANPQIIAWSKNASGTPTVDPTTIDSATTLYPVYAAKTYKVTYKTQDGKTEIASRYVAANTAFKANDGADVTNFAGWYEAKDKNDFSKGLSDTPFDFAKGASSDVTLYGKVGAAPATVTFYYDASNVYGTDKIAAGSQVSKPTDPTDNSDKGRPFVYWSTNPAAAADAQASQEYNWTSAVADGLKLYAVWGSATKSSAKVSLDENWNKGAVTEVSAAADGTVTLPEAAARDGYKFLGWAKAATDTVAKYKAGDTVTVTDDQKFYAVWQSQTDADYEAVKVKLTNTDPNGTKNAYYEAASYNAYVKVYEKYFADANGTLKANVDKATAVKAVKEAQDKIVEKASQALHRLYNRNNGDHFYTANDSEAAVLTALGWNYEGSQYRVVANRFADGTARRTIGTGVYSVYNPNTGEHLLTTDEAEAESLAKVGWNNEGVKFYAPQGAKKAVYRVYNPNTTGPAHHYADKSEATGLVKLGWRWDNDAKALFYFG